MYNKLTDIDKIYLTRQEYRFLKRLRRHHLLLPSNMDSLYRADLVEYDELDEVDAFNMPKKADTVHLTEKAFRYFECHRLLTPDYIVTSIIIPIVIAIITTLITIVLSTWLSVFL